MEYNAILMPESAGPVRDGEPAADDHLDSWKEIAAYLRRSERTVRRWEQTEGLPVYRHSHQKGSSVYAFRSELTVWLKNRRSVDERSQGSLAPTPNREESPGGAAAGWPALFAGRWWSWGTRLLLVLTLLIMFVMWPSLRHGDNAAVLSPATRLTADAGTNIFPAISADGSLLVYSSDRAGAGQQNIWIQRLDHGKPKDN